MTFAVFCEAAGSAGLELIGKARELAPAARIAALAEGEPSLVSSCFACGADEVHALPPCPDDCLQGSYLAQAMKELEPDVALFPATVRGRFLSAWVAAKLDTGLTADCTALALTPEGLLLQSRPAFGGHLTADILCKERRPQMASVRPGIFPLPQEKPSAQGPVKPFLPQPLPALMRRLSLTAAPDGASLSQAKIIVAGGKGIGGAEGFATLAELARLLGGALGATRSAVDAGWISYDHQIGQTGVAVRPDLYLAFGVSGLIQHVVGMNGAKTVVAVNTDRMAAIFDYADYGIVADWKETAQKMIAFLRERKGP